MHGNWDALAAVLRWARGKSFDSFVVLGDLVGYGAAPGQVIDGVHRLGDRLAIVRGNHDKVVAGLDDGAGFNPVAMSAVNWTREKLPAANLRLLADLPRGPLETDGFLLCHGSPLDEDQYLVSEAIAADVFSGSNFSLCFFGHTHIPCVFSHSFEGLAFQPLTGAGGCFEIRADVRYLVNPGSVGQPRDRDPRAAFMTYDSSTKSMCWYRVDYPLARAQKRIRKAGLPEVLAERLAHGL